jgi:hypothetical protein
MSARLGAPDLAAQLVDLNDPVDLVAEELDAQGSLVLVLGKDLDHVSAHPEAPALEVDVVARVEHVDEPAQQLVPRQGGAGLQVGVQGAVGGGRSQPVDAGDARHHQDVAPRQQGMGGGVAQLVEVVVDRRVLLDVGVGGGEIRLRLVVVVVGDEVLDGVLGEELAELVAELGRQRLVVRDHERGPLHALDDPGHRERLARAGAEIWKRFADGAFSDRARLVAHGRAYWSEDQKLSHAASVAAARAGSDRCGFD